MAQIHTSVTLVTSRDLTWSSGRLTRQLASHISVVAHISWGVTKVSSVLIGIYDCVYRAKGCGMLLARVTTILRSDSLGTVYAAFGIHQSHSCLCLIRIEAGKLAQTGFEDTS